MKSLTSIACESIREHWDKYSLNTDDPLFDIVLEDWYNVYEFDKKNEFVKTLVAFATNKQMTIHPQFTNRIIKHDDNTMIIKGLNPSDRQSYHEFCDQLGLWHESKDAKKGKRWFYAYKPDVWKWNYTGNKYGEPPGYYAQKRAIAIKRLQNMTCDACGDNAHNTQLFKSVYVRGKYCQSCVECVSDENGGILNDHKFEPMR